MLSNTIVILLLLLFGTILTMGLCTANTLFGIAFAIIFGSFIIAIAIATKD